MARRGIKLINYRSKFKSGCRNAAVACRGGEDLAGAERRNGRLYLAGLAVSVIGDNALSLAAGIWVKSLTGSSSEAALVSVCVYAPSLAGPLAGLVADRVRRRRILVWLNVVSAALVLPLLAVGGPGSAWIIFAVMTWYGIHLTLSGPAEDALFAVMLSRELRQELNGRSLGLQETGRLASPLFGAGLFALVGGGMVSVFDAITFGVAALMLARIRLREARPVPAPRHWRADLLAGFGHIRRTPELRRLLVAASVPMSFSAVLVAAQYSLVQGLHEPPSFLGMFSAALGAGSIAASLVSGRLLRTAGERWLAVLGMVNFAAGSAMRAAGWLPLAVAGSAVLGFALPWLFLALLSLAQRCTPPELQGRVSAAVTLVFFGPQAPLQALGALAIRFFSYQQLYLAGAAIAAVTAMTFAWAGRWRTPVTAEGRPAFWLGRPRARERGAGQSAAARRSSPNFWLVSGDAVGCRCTTLGVAGNSYHTRCLRSSRTMGKDLRESTEYAAVAEYLRRLHEPAFGRPHRVTDLVTTPDASRVVVTGSVYDELAGLPRTALYEVTNGELRALTTGGGSAKAGRLAPDGSRLAFLSDRATADVFQLYLLEDGQLGEARPAPAVPGTVEYLAWSPDGTRILLGVAGFGAEMADAQGSGTAGSGQSGLPSWYPQVEAGTPEDAWRSLWIYAPDSGELAKVSPEGLNVWEAAWSGPGHVLAITSAQPGEDDWYTAVLSRLDIATGQVTELLRSDVQLGLPAGTPDGDRAAVVEAACSDRWIVAGDLILLDLVAGTRCAVDTAGTDVTAVQWIDGTRIGYVGQRHLDSVAGVADTGPGPLPETITGKDLASSGQSWASWFYPAGVFTSDGRVVVIRDDYDVPQQVAIVGNGTGQVLASLAHAGTDYIRSVAGSAENVTWDAPDGTPIEGIVCTPAGDGPFPLVVNVHGGPIGAYQRSWMMGSDAVPLLVSRGYAVLLPNPRGSSGRGQEFAAAVIGDMGGADTYDYLSGIDAMVERGIADPARIGTMGVSYGGFMSAWLVTQDQRFKAAVAGSPVTEWYSFTFTTNIPRWGLWFLDDADPEETGNQVHTRSPVLHASKATTPTLLTAGAKDGCTPAGQAREFYQALIGHGVDSELVIYPGEGHGVRQFPAVTDYLTRLVTWFERYMPARLASAAGGEVVARGHH